SVIVIESGEGVPRYPAHVRRDAHFDLFVRIEGKRCNRLREISGGRLPDFSAQESGLGYLYQARYAFWLLLDGPEEQEVVLETLDDIVLRDRKSTRLNSSH